MQNELIILIITAISIAFLHTLTGPDHYIPFIALSKSRGWSVRKTIFWTVICGCGHVWSSVLLGLGGAALGWSLSTFTWIENIRGGFAGWLMLLFGLVYCVWGLSRARTNNLHKHFETEEDGTMFVYQHDHNNTAKKEKHKLTPWVMFIIFSLGPCEPMIPLLYMPGQNNSWTQILIIVSVYTICTLATMLVLVLTGYYGFTFFKAAQLNRFVHAVGGLSIFISGAGMVMLDW